MYRYRVEIDTERDWAYSSGLADVSDFVESAQWAWGLSKPYDCIAAPASMQIKLKNNGDFDIYDSNALYYDKVRVGTLVRVSVWFDDTWITLAVMKITRIRPAIEGLDKKLYLECSDILSKFLDMEFVPPLQTDVRVDEALFKLHESSNTIYPTEDYYQFIGHTSIGDGRSPFDGGPLINFETAYTSLPYIGDNLGRDSKVKTMNYVRDAVEAELNALYFFDCRNELFTFFNRYHNGLSYPLWTVTDGFTAEYSDPQRYMVNMSTVNYYPRKVGAEHSVLFSSDSLPIAITARSTRKFTIQYRDPNNESASVGALDVDEPIMGTDIIGNSAEDGSGSDWTQYLICNLKKGASSSELTIYCRKEGDPVYLTTFQIRGQPITIYNKESVTEINDDSIFRHERVPAIKNMYGVGEADFAQAIARFNVDSFGEPAEYVERLTVYLTEENANNLFYLTLGDVISVIDTQKGHEGNYMIVAEKHNISEATGLHFVIYTLRPANQGSLFILGSSTYDGGDVLRI